ncbi:hypothetical protein ACR6HW_16350 [Fusibacter sp. JL298sf-3]
MPIDYMKMQDKFFEKKLCDAIQFLKNINENQKIILYSNEFLKKVIEQNEIKINEYNMSLNYKIQDRIETKSNKPVEIKAFDDTVELLGIDVGLSFLASKYIKDILQYSRNIFDSLAQIVNLTLFANDAFKIDRVDFGFILKKLKDSGEEFQETLSAFEVISLNSDYIFLTKANNRVKHIKDLPTKMSFQILGEDNEIKHLIEGFTKDNNAFTSVDIQVCIEKMIKLVDDSIKLVFDSILKDIENAHNYYRIHEINYKAQISKKYDENITWDDIRANSDYAFPYVDLTSFGDSSIPSTVSILFSRKIESYIEVITFKEDELLVMKDNRFVGYLKYLPSVNDVYNVYKKYEFVNDNGRKYHEFLINQVKMNYMPAFMNASFTFYEKDDLK